MSSPRVIRLRVLPVNLLLKRTDEKKTFLVTATTAADKLAANIKTAYGLREDETLHFHLFGAIIDLSDIVEPCQTYIKEGVVPFFSVLEEAPDLWVVEAEVSLIHTCSSLIHTRYDCSRGSAA